MPRSFLVRKYFRRRNYLVKNEDFEDYETDIAQSLCLSTQNKIRTECYNYEELVNKSNWNYEAEKCYWFELSKKEHFLQASGDELIENWEIDKNDEDIEACCEEDKKIQVSNKKTTDIIQKEDQKEELVWENIEEKLSHMLGENPDIIKKNIKQFLENNRILIKEIAFETELNEESVIGYINGNEIFSEAQRQDFYRWYLLKILRPPNGSDGKSFTCFKCGKIFAYKSYLERHVKYVCPDNTGRTWKCSYCSKAFQYPCYLRRHIRSHTGESPYKCDKCDRAFVRSTDLQRHIRNHTGEKPYKCTECDRAFARSTDLKRHMRTHTGEKPYKCWQCGKTFSQSGSLQTHLHTHNKDTVVGRKLSKGSK